MDEPLEPATPVAPPVKEEVAWWEWPIVVVLWPFVTAWDLLKRAGRAAQAAVAQVLRWIGRALAWPLQRLWAGLVWLGHAVGRAILWTWHALALPARWTLAALRWMVRGFEWIMDGVIAALRWPARMLERGVQLLLRGLAAVLRWPAWLLHRGLELLMTALRWVARGIDRGLERFFKGLAAALRWPVRTLVKAISFLGQKLLRLLECLAYPIGHLISAARRLTRQLLKPVQWAIGAVAGVGWWIHFRIAGPVRFIRAQSARMRAWTKALIEPLRARARALRERAVDLRRRVRATLRRR